MKLNRNHTRLASLLIFLLLLATPAVLSADTKEKLGAAKGNGTIKIGTEEFKVSSVVIKLMNNGKAELNILSDITFFITGSWSKVQGDAYQIDLKINADASSGFEGEGKLFLRQSSKSKDQKEIKSLTLQGTSRTTKRPIDVTFVAD